MIQEQNQNEKITKLSTLKKKKQLKKKRTTEEVGRHTLRMSYEKKKKWSEGFILGVSLGDLYLYYKYLKEQPFLGGC